MNTSFLRLLFKLQIVLIWITTERRTQYCLVVSVNWGMSVGKDIFLSSYRNDWKGDAFLFMIIIKRFYFHQIFLFNWSMYSYEWCFIFQIKIFFFSQFIFFHIFYQYVSMFWFFEKTYFGWIWHFQVLVNFNRIHVAITSENIITSKTKWCFPKPTLLNIRETIKTYYMCYFRLPTDLNLYL